MDGSCQKSDTSDASVFEDGTCRLVLIGKTGSGKSATANTIIGRNCFKEGTGINSETKIGGFNYVNNDKLTIEVMDTPGLADTDDDDVILVEEIKKSVFAMHPGPHALLLVLRGKARFTKEEFQVYQALKEIFGAQFASYLIVVFTSVNAKEEYAKIMEDQIRRCAKLNTVLNEANWRYVLFDNKADENEKRGQVHELLGKVKSLVVTNQSSYFRHNFSDHLRDSFDEMVNDELKLLRKKMLITISDASNVTTQEFCDSTDQSKATRNLGEDQETQELCDSTDQSKATQNLGEFQETQEICDSTDQSKATQNLGEFQKTPDGGSVTLRAKQTQETNESNKQPRVGDVDHQFNQPKLTRLPKRCYSGPRTRKIYSSVGNTNALESESDKKKCENLSSVNEPTEQASVEVDNRIHRQSKIDIKDKIVNQPEKMTETQRHEYRRSLSELPDKVKEEFEKKNVKDIEQCTVM